MSKGRHAEARIIGALKQVEAGQRVEDTLVLPAAMPPLQFLMLGAYCIYPA